ncbi:MAG: fibronectin type III domain-containing protein, partial [Anaerolineales bacterium]|nr:fibronectin type III domain-containing protein [Anaerolineales bacterium]
MRKALVSTLIIFNTVLIAQTDVSGIISSSTTWSASGSPYNLTGEVQLAYGATLTVDPGVTVNGNNNILKIFGKLSAIGTASSFTILNDIDIQASSNTVGSNNELAETVIQYARLYGGRLLDIYSGSIGSISLKDSELYKVNHLSAEELNIYLPYRDCFIERNIFMESGQIATVVGYTYNVYIKNNAFTAKPYISENRGYAVISRQGENDDIPLIEHNTFVTTEDFKNKAGDTIKATALSLDSGNLPKMKAINNYWSTTDESKIQSMIYDKNDDLNVNSVIPYSPWLTEPDSDTPTRDTTSPTAGTVSDGTSTDISSTTIRTSLSANWSGFSDSHSGIEDYSYSIGTTSGGTDIKSWTSNGTSTSVTVSDLSLTVGTTYYFSVKATDYAGNVSGVATSNGVKLLGIIYTVKTDGTGGYTTIQAALDGSTSGDTVLVYEGTYKERVEISGGRYVKSQFNSSSDSTAIKNTIIQCPGDDRLLIKDSTLRGFSFLGYGIDVSGTSTLKHILIEDNVGHANFRYNISVGSYSGADAVIEDTKILNSTGGGIIFTEGKLTGKNIVISNNSKAWGGMGFRCIDSSDDNPANVAHLENIRIAHNKSYSSGVSGGA